MRDTTDSSTGNIRLVVDRTSCTSCADSAIREFYRRRPEITLDVVQGKRID
ncbi:hypothetical protein H1P_220012 [Hyella patelloides LEGE 07179]|uniref:Uncharacterized protein n=1 Tax=Hyella patelloides LEGE 07179 TaxID=945734 RepID=A0A563VQT9_9CYAN|nr:hypothetical protein [Hyella patelloides]VEP13771.1 hypothetical protein H1P_220012 [Hyella patelloides LEGE 07179]